MCHARKDASLAWTSGHDISCVLASCRVLLLAVVGIFASPASSFACATPPQPIIDLDLGRYYTDAAGTRVDPSRLATHRAATADLKAYIRGITRSADAAWQARTASARADAARCGTAWLIAWAEAGAYLGRMKSKQAEYQRKWDLAGAALAYLKLRHAVSSRDHATIGAWLSAIADNAERFQLAPGRKPNNHLNWLALGSAATAIATDNAQRWRSARRWMQQAARAIGDDGTLPLEMARGGRALHYHAFAMMPLVVLAELAHARGENWYAFGDGALHRLVAVTTAGLVEPAVFDQAAGQRQERPVNARAGWATLYARRFPRRGIPPSLTRKRRHRLLGGDVRVLLAALRRDGRNDGAR